jgi:TonB family protein
MKPRNALLVSLLVIAAGIRADGRLGAPGPIAGQVDGRDDPPHAQPATPEAKDVGKEGIASISAEDAKVLRAVVKERFPSWPEDVLVLDRTAWAGAGSDAPKLGSQLSLRGANLGPHVTVVTSGEAAAALSESSDSTVLVELSQPAYETGGRQATVKYKVSRHAKAGFRWLTGTVTLTLRNDMWAMTNRQESAESDPPLRVGGDVKPPVLTKRVEAIPTPEAVRSRISGVVILEVMVDENGHVADARVLKPLPFGLDGAAITAVKQWEFSPGTLNGKPVTVQYNVTVQFVAK